MRVRSLAAHALGEIGDPQALPLLRDMAATETDERLQVAACYAICRILKH
jgi:HEAT repeat protein